MEIRRLPAVFLALAAAALSPPLAADDVHLINGNSFEGVIATVEGSRVRIRFAHGEITLPANRVLHIDREDSAVEEYLARKAALLAAESATAEDWLALARWAETRELAHGVRESALQAARLDPDLEGLAPILRGLGLVHDEELGGWFPYAEAMHRRGFVWDDGVWITREAKAEKDRAEEQMRARLQAERAERVAERALEHAIEARVQAEVAREVARVQGSRGVVYATPVVVGTFFPAFLPVHGVPGHRMPSHGGPEAAPETDRFGNVVNPFDPPRSHGLQNRDFGAGLGAGLPDGWGGAPGRIHQMSSGRP